MSLDVTLTATRPTVVYTANITHNLGDMAGLAGLYSVLWRPEEVGLHFAADLIPWLEEGLARLEADPAVYRALSPENGWGTYEGLVGFVRRYLEACKANPDAVVGVDR